MMYLQQMNSRWQNYHVFKFVKHVNNIIKSLLMIFLGLRKLLSFFRDQYVFVLSLFIYNILTFLIIDMHKMIEDKCNFKTCAWNRYGSSYMIEIPRIV